MLAASAKTSKRPNNSLMTISPITQQRGWSQLFEVRLRMDNPAQWLTPVLLPIDVTCGTAQVAVPARFAHGQRDRSATPPCVVCFAGLSRGVSCRDLLTKKRVPAGRQVPGLKGPLLGAGQSRDSPTSPNGGMGRSLRPTSPTPKAVWRVRRTSILWIYNEEK